MNLFSEGWTIGITNGAISSKVEASDSPTECAAEIASLTFLWLHFARDINKQYR